MRIPALVPFCLWIQLALAQTGPAGIGASSTNVLWLDANQGVTHSSGVVTAWNDRSGNANHALLPGPIPTAQPTRVANSVNGYPSLNFDGVDDQLWIGDVASLDLTQWDIFLVVRADSHKNYSAWMVKGDDGQENFEMLSYNDGNIHTPVFWSDGTRTFPSAPAGQVSTTTFDIIEYSFASAAGRRIYTNNGLVYSDSESKTPQVNNLPIYVGNERSTSGRCIDGSLAEVIIYNTRLNATRRILLNNYLAAKYNRSLAANDIYNQDNVANGNFDHDVAGIGQVSSTDNQTDSRGSGLVRITAGAGLSDDEFFVWGHNNGALGTYGVTGLPPGVQGRWQRVWRVNEVNSAGTSGGSIDVGAVDVTFDLTGFAVGSASDLRLLVDVNNNGSFADDTPISGAVSIGGGNYRFPGVTAINNNMLFTLGSANIGMTPLPIELLHFSATEGPGRTVQLDWATASERDNDYFTVERSRDLEAWETVVERPGAGNSSSTIDYHEQDPSPHSGLSYYRLSQTDVDGTSTLFRVAPVMIGATDALSVFPVPNEGHFIVSGAVPGARVELFDAGGALMSVRARPIGQSIEVDASMLPEGVYHLRSGDVARSIVIVPH